MPDTAKQNDAIKDGFKDQKAQELHSYMVQVDQLNAIADTCHIALSDHITKALRDAATSIFNLSTR